MSEDIDTDLAEAAQAPEASSWDIYHQLRDPDEKTDMLFKIVDELEAKIDADLETNIEHT